MTNSSRGVTSPNAGVRASQLTWRFSGGRSRSVWQGGCETARAVPMGLGLRFAAACARRQSPQGPDFQHLQELVSPS
eukprot:scaffold62036_cov32-Tisochrysis_lutea.AAC.2